jgi:hypothetical protein
MFDFVDNQTFIQELDDKKVRNQLLTSIRDIIVNHHMNWKPAKKDKEEKDKEEKDKAEKDKEEKDKAEKDKEDKEE